MRLKETKQGVFIVHKQGEDLSCKKVYQICKDEIAQLKADEEIKHLRYIVDKFRKKIERHDNQIDLYLRLMERIEREGKTEDSSNIFDKLQ